MTISLFTTGYSGFFCGRDCYGAIDEVAAWNCALSGAQVGSIYGALSATKTVAISEAAQLAFLLGLGVVGLIVARRRHR